MKRILSIPALLLATAGAAHAEPIAAGGWSAVAGKSTITYNIVHKFHEVTGTSTTPEGKALVAGDQVQVQVRVPSASFTSGNDNRDSNAQAVVEAAKYPYITIKGTGKLCDPGAASCTFVLNTMLDFHGVQKPYAVDVKLTAADASHLTATFRLPVVLTHHAIELPSLMFIPIDDLMNVDGVIQMEHKS
jgi:polyisoprenoid-binding protein YceI